MAISYTAGSTEGGYKPVPAGVYILCVASAEETVSKSKKPMIKLKLGILSGAGKSMGSVYEYLVASQETFWKIDQFLQAAGEHPGEGEEVELEASEMVGWELYASLGIEKDSKGKDRNFVAEYLSQEDGAAAVKEAAKTKKKASLAKAAADADEEFA